MADLVNQAVAAALRNDWSGAIELNRTLLKENADDVEALNRLARAHKENGNLKEAQKNYRKVLTLDKFNPIAQKNLKLLEAMPKNCKKKPSNHTHTGNCNHCSPQMFLEEPGKTKIISLVNLAPTSVLIHLGSGDQVNLLIKRHSVIVIDQNETYLGALPDDMSKKLTRFIAGGNHYEAYLKTVGKNCLSVLVREIFRASKFRNQPTFPGAGGENYSFGIEDSWTDEERKCDDDELTEEEPQTTAS